MEEDITEKQLFTTVARDSLNKRQIGSYAVQENMSEGVTQTTTDIAIYDKQLASLPRQLAYLNELSCEDRPNSLYIRSAENYELMLEKTSKIDWLLAAGGTLYEKNEKLKFQNKIDEMTGLLNRSGLMEGLEKYVNNFNSQRQYERRSSDLQGDTDNAIAVVFMDLDGFKAINDELGHDIGDEVLRRFADILKVNARINDVVCRLGGDEFVAIMNNDIDELGAKKAIDRLKEAVSSIELADSDLSVGLSSGVAILEEGESAEDVLKRADMLMYEDKKRTKYNLKN